MNTITLYTAPTANGFKVSIALEELGLDYFVRYLRFEKSEQKTADFLKLNPNGRIPVIVDLSNDDFLLTESGAILLYLAERTGKLMPSDSNDKHKVIQWLMFQMSAIGPMMGQAMFFQRIAAPKGIEVPFAVERYKKESERLLSILDFQLRNNDFLCGEYTIADIAVFPWARAYRWANLDIQRFTNLKRWFKRVEARDAVQRGMRVPTGKMPLAFDERANLDDATKTNAEKYDI